MTSVAVLKKKIQRVEQILAPKPKGYIAVKLWSPDGGSDGKGGEKTIVMEAYEYA